MNEELRIVLFGKEGCGKSATGNTILGKNKFQEAKAIQSGTSVCKAVTGEYAGKKLLVVDTPGIYDSEVLDKTTVNEVLRCIALTSPGPHVFLWVINACERFSKRYLDVFRLMETLFGDSLKGYVILVFTNAEQFQEDLQDKMLNPPDYLEKVLKDVKGRWVVLSNKSEDTEANLAELMSRVIKLVNSNGGPLSNYLTQKTEHIVETRLRGIQHKDDIDLEAAKAKFRKGLEKDEEQEFMTKLFIGVGADVDRCLGGILGGYATVGPLGAAEGFGVGATSGASGTVVCKSCSIM